jgi:hypothetical protein
MDQDRIVLLLINGFTVEAVTEQCMKHGMKKAAAKRAVNAARKRLALAAEVEREEYLGKAVMRLEDLYAKSQAAKDIKSALAAQKELNRLLELGNGDAAKKDEAKSEAEQCLAAIREMLFPLQLADETHPLQEHVRVAVELIRLHGLGEEDD